MTIGGDFIPSGDTFDEEPSYPTVFGIRFTPTVSGIAIALLGAAAAVWMLVNLVQPTWQQTQTLSASVAEKQQQLLNTEETQEKIQDARQELEEAKQLQADVLSLFADEESLDTLLLDINARVRSGNGDLTRFEATTQQPETIADSSFGVAANGLLQRQVYQVAMDGTYAELQSIMRGIERLQTLVVVQNLQSQLDTSTQLVRVDPQGRLLATGQPTTNIQTTFDLVALLPAPTANPPSQTPAATEGTEPGATPAQASPSPAP